MNTNYHLNHNHYDCTTSINNLLQQKQEQSIYEYRFEYSLVPNHQMSSCQNNHNNNNLLRQQQIDTNYLSNQSLTPQTNHQQQQTNHQQQHRLIHRSTELIVFNCFTNQQTQSLINTLFTHYTSIYTSLALRLLKITQFILLPNLNLSKSAFVAQCQQKLEYQRQLLVQSIKQLTLIFYNQKQHYMKLLSLVAASAVFKILTLQDERIEVQFEAVFHTVYWQLTGTHSTSQLLKKLLAQTFNPVHFHHYLMNQQLSATKPMTNINSSAKMTGSLVASCVGSNKSSGIKGSVNFDVRNNFGNKTSGINCSVKDVKEPVYKLDINNIKQRQQMTFSKAIIKKQNFKNKQNISNHLNNSKINNLDNKNIDTLQQKLTEQQSSLNSNKKDFNFKKDRTAFFENFSKTKSNNKKPFADFLSSNKKPTFASFLQQKKLHFQA